MDQGSNPCLLHRQADSFSLSLQGSPYLHLWVKKSFSLRPPPARCQSIWWSYTQKVRIKSTLMAFKILQSLKMFQFSSVTQSYLTLAIPWTVACQASLSITNSPSFLKLMSIESVMPSNHHILCHPLLLLPSIFPSIRVFSDESVLHIRWLKYWKWLFLLNLVLESVF